MTELIERLLKGEGKLSLLLLEAKEYAEQSEDKELIEFIDSEINGYAEKSLPNYREINSEIVGTIQDSYGRITHNEYPLDFSVISKDLGMDISKTNIPDGIAFIESNIEHLKSQTVLKPMPIQMVKMLDEIFTYNNQGLHLVAASFKFGRATVEFILSKVRQELVLGLKRIQQKEKTEIKSMVSLNSTDSNKKVFVTYAWENEEHNDTVISFVNFLREKGYDATMDRKKTQEETAINFNQMMVDGIRTVDKVIVILSPKYKERADETKGGVGFEFSIILEQLKSTNNKFIFVSFGKSDYKDITPIAIGGREILDLKKEQDEHGFNNLFAKLESKNTIVFSDVSDEKVEVKQKEIKPFKL